METHKTFIYIDLEERKKETNRLLSKAIARYL